MSAFYAYLTQASEGCDYTIGCGMELVKLKAATRDEATAELKRLVQGYVEDGWRQEGYTHEQKLKEALLLEVSGADPMPVQDWYTEADLEDEARERQKIEAEERALLDRLQNKYR